MTRVLVFSGTAEGRSISNMLHTGGVDVCVRVATEYGAATGGYAEGLVPEIGSCGGVEGICEKIVRESIGIVVDATHPYATKVSSHIREACSITGAECIRITRDGREPVGDDVVVVGSVAEAVEYLKGTTGRVLAATGSNDIDLYTSIPDYRERVVARVLSIPSSVLRCAEYGFEGRNLICGQGPFSEEANYATLRDIGARYLVTKDSGTVGGFDDKVRAARRAGATVVLVRRPEDPGITYDEAVAVLCGRFGIEPPASPVETGAARRSVTVVGIGVGRDGMTVRASRRVAGCDLLIGAPRMLESVEVGGRATLDEYRAEEVVSFLDSHPEYVSAAVLMSGDVGFYSGAKRLLERIDRDRYDVHVECGISSVVHLCSKLETSWQDAHLVSAHGKDCNLVGACRTHPKVFSLMTGDESVRSMCRSFIDHGLGDVTVSVGCDLGYPEERIHTGSPEEILGMPSFGPLCVSLITNPSPDTRCPLGIPDEEFIRGDAPMTKSEVRTLSVAKLKLSPDSVVYDVGAGTGSVSVEMALAAPLGTVYAVEREDVAADLIEENKRKFGTPNVTVVRGLAPEAMADLPAPTHAFIGGSAGNLRQIVECILAKNPDARIVINSVTMETMAETARVISELGLVEEEISCINVSKSRKLGGYHLMTAQNPVYIAVVRGR